MKQEARQFATLVPFSPTQVYYVFDRLGVDLGKRLLLVCAVGVIDPIEAADLIKRRGSIEVTL